MPKLSGCMDEQSIREALAVSKERTFDQLVMHYIQISLSGLAMLFSLFNVFGALIRRCIR